MDQLSFIYIVFVIPITVVASIGCYRVGRWRERKRIVSEFDEILLRLRQLSWSQNYMGLDKFLHDLTEDTPWRPPGEKWDAGISEKWMEGQINRPDKRGVGLITRKR